MLLYEFTNEVVSYDFEYPPSCKEKYQFEETIWHRNYE